MTRMRTSTMALAVALACGSLLALFVSAEMVEPQSRNKHKHHDYYDHHDSDDQHYTITLYPGDNDWCPDDVATPTARNLNCPESVALK
jgi:hypothetical protein